MATPCSGARSKFTISRRPGVSSDASRGPPRDGIRIAPRAPGQSRWPRPAPPAHRASSRVAARATNRGVTAKHRPLASRRSAQ
ncbi:MAG: hypothetical protein MZU95_16180 [Desulfomicrobium escambiense]|nr:hypothetical protein [Desulfomicrobium escambiense]